MAAFATHRARGASEIVKYPGCDWQLFRLALYQLIE
jgi:hypothetical protein